MFGMLKASIKKNKLLYKISYAIYYFVLSTFYGILKHLIKTDKKAVLFVSFMGEQYSDNPKAVYEYMLGQTKYKDFKYYWAFKSPDKFRRMDKLNPAVMVRVGSLSYYKACARAGYWISNARMRNELSKKKDQIYLQTWHGTPLKKLGYDIGVKDFKDIGGDLKSLQSNYSLDAKRYDYMLSVSPYYTEKLSSAFGLERINKTDIFLEYGYPRNDILFEYKKELLPVIKAELGIPADNDKKIILYAPTFRETQLGGKGYEYSLALDLDRLYEEIGDKYLIIMRLHYYIASGLDLNRHKGFAYDAGSYHDIAGLYLISDMLITDYSSVFFDYANLNRPIAFYMYDLELYNSSMHDFYIGIDELPGDIAYTQDELTGLIKTAFDDTCASQNAARLQKFNDKFNPHREPCSAKVVSTLIDKALS